MWCSYDENLNDNPFFSEISKNHADILTKAAEESWILCVPRHGTLEQRDINTDLILDHILVPSPQGTYLCTLSKKQFVSVKNKKIQDQSDHAVNILFEETFYIDNNSKKYTVWCLDGPLFTSRAVCTHRHGHLQTLHDCVDFLWAEEAGGALEAIRNLCWKFMETNPEFELEDLQSQKDLIGSLYSQCLQTVLRHRNVTSIDNFKVAIETFMHSCLDRTLVRAVNTLTLRGDAYVNKIIRNHAHLQLKDLNIPLKYCDVITNAKCQLNRLNNYVTILDKLNIIKLTFEQLTEENSMTSDDLLQIFIFLILKLNINNWVSNLVFLTQFRFSSMDVSDKNSFLTTSLEAAVEYVKDRSHFCSKAAPTGGAAFEAIRSGDLCAFTAKVDRCHPLCTCERCSNGDVVNANGQSLLIYASILNRVDFVELLIDKDIDARDHSGRSALHYAALRGFQDVLLLLVNAKADVNLADNDGNTALHLCTNNGHDNCVKALLYTCKDLRIDAQNKNGDTALMLSLKSNFLEITRALLESHACVSIANRRKQRASAFVNNYYAERLLMQFSFNDSSQDDNSQIDHSSIEDSGVTEAVFDSCVNEHGTKPKSLEQYKRLELLLKAIENNDFPLTSFYLGYSSETTNEDLSLKCHPLCDCPKCEDLPPERRKDPSERVNVNMCNGDGLTPLHVAAKNGRTDVVRILLDSKALPNLRTYKTLHTPLHLACISQRLTVVRELMKCGGCQVDLKDHLGYTPLYYACTRNDARTVEVLLDNGADPEAKNWQGMTVLKEVQDRRLFGIAKLLNERRLSFGDDSDDNIL